MAEYLQENLCFGEIGRFQDLETSFSEHVGGVQRSLFKQRFRLRFITAIIFIRRDR